MAVEDDWSAPALGTYVNETVHMHGRSQPCCCQPFNGSTAPCDDAGDAAHTEACVADARLGLPRSPIFFPYH